MKSLAPSPFVKTLNTDHEEFTSPSIQNLSYKEVESKLVTLALISDNCVFVSEKEGLISYFHVSNFLCYSLTSRLHQIESCTSVLP